MTTRLTLPQQRAQETRQRILEAAHQVFARDGYGQTAVEEILTEAGISRGAFYHHFSGKEELFKTLLDDHLRGALIEFDVFGKARSLREVIERFVDLLVDDIRGHEESGALSFEFLAQAVRDDRARDSYAEFHRRARDLVAGVLGIGQSAGVIRADLDAGAAAWLLIAIREGLSALKALDAEGIDLGGLKKAWTELIERFVKGEGEGDIEGLGDRAAAFSRQFSGDDGGSAPERKK